MYYLYVLKSKKTDKFYIGYAKDLQQRILQHNNGESLATKSAIPWELVYYEAYASQGLARKREAKLKHHGKGFAELKKRILED
ncbi:MAG: GIY-YIG nuclease family protein [Candidatus Moraniibacteriota bacterium]|nr:MAG: GIY-YIG nuclease family protein [Candidatus Moranbacteria bacterium]